jgi:CubicO group peptidase (beta-lactamase class C family)
MTNIKFVLIVALTIVFIGCNQSNPSKVLQSKKIDQLTPKQDSIIAAHLNDFPENTQIAMAIIKDGQVKYHGFIMNDTLKSIANKDSVFEIGSITKVFTSVLLAHFAASNQIKLNEPINKHLPFKLKDDIQLTFKQLATHTSGLPRMPGNFQIIAMKNVSNPFKEYSEEALSDYLSNYVNEEYNPEQGYAYSNLGAGLLGYTLEQISAHTYQELLDSLITKPLNMSKTTTNRNDVKQNLVVGLNALGQPTPNWDLNVLSGAGAILSNVEDLSKFAMAQFDSTNTALNLTREKAYVHNENLSMGLGWHFSTKDGNEWMWHNGGTGGYSSVLGLNMQNKNGIIILTNISAYHKNSSRITSIALELLKTLL